MPEIKKVLIANRGEIALRIMRTCKEMGISTVAVYSDPDEFSPHSVFADESIRIGPAPSSQSYLLADTLINVAKQSGSDAIHPGYGFLSENADFSEKCVENGIVFIGPSPKSIRLMGDKTKARELMEKAGVPLPPGTTTALKDTEEAVEVAKSIGFPVLIKAAAGGGGKGMRIVYDGKDVENAVKAAKSEAKSAFGDDRVYIEKYLEEPRHVEFQVFGDSHGNVVHFFDRECSVQRRHQKVVEEAPCAILDDDLRNRMAEAAVLAARSCNYVGAGTIEFLVDKHRNYYFLEMNTRLQVEHPVTEFITGVDLVKLQLHVAEGREIPFKQDQIIMRGHSIECRICAEDPAEQFLPSTGFLEKYDIPSGPGVRTDSGVREGQEITINYDPLMAKLAVYAETREDAINRMHRALEEFTITGVKTTIPFCKFVMKHPAFISAEYDTHFIKNYYTGAEQMSNDSEIVLTALISSLSASNHSHNRQRENLTTKWWAKRRA